jgi:uncharacterized YccA/Bax inhibitor family protein
VAAASPTMGQPSASQGGIDNPALNPQAFERGMADVSAAERQGMTVAGTDVKTGLLLVILIAAAFGWSQVEIVTLNGREVALQPAWSWLALLLTFILGIAGAFAIRASPIIGPLYALSQGSPLGIALSLGVIVLGALSLPLSFEFISRAATAGAPKFMEWYGAYGLMLSIIWIYVSVLRLLALLRRSQG